MAKSRKSKAKRNLVLISLVLLLGVTLILLINSGFMQTQFTDFTPVFCNDYEFTCCTEKVGPIASTFDISDERAYRCPLVATKCEIGGVDGILPAISTYIGSENCKVDNGFFGDRYKCSDEQRSSRKTLLPGESMWIMQDQVKTANTAGRLTNVKVYITQLNFCGTSGCVQGVPVLGSDQCKFNPELNTIYTSTSSLSGKKNVASYTVPKGDCVLSFQSGNRHICGYLEETCSRDSDCTGHTYGNQECIGRTLQTYGCRDFGNRIIGGDVGPFDSLWNSGSDVQRNSANTFGSRCEITRAEQVQCCGDNDCGGKQFCDTSDFKCKEDVQCNKDYDCGVSIQCDFSTKTLKTPVCSSGMCDFSEVDVMCCTDINCPTDSYCSADRECVKKQIGKTACVFECCEDEELYFDRNCPDDRPICKDNSCYEIDEDNQSGACESCFSWLLSKTGSTECTAKVYLERTWYNPGTWLVPDEGINQNLVCPIFFGFLALIGALVLLIMAFAVRAMSGKKKKTSSGSAGGSNIIINVPSGIKK